MGELPEGRKPLTWNDLTPKHSSWEAEAKALRADRDTLLEKYSAQSDKYAELAEKYCALRAENGRLRAALEFYRDQHRIAAKPTIDAQWAETRLKTDAGARAAAALQERSAALSELRDQARPAKADAPEQDMPDGFWDGAEMRPAEGGF